MARRTATPSITDLRGRTGQAATDPLGVPNYLAAEMINCDRNAGSLAHKRTGASAVTMGSVFTGKLSHLARFVPGSDETAAQFVGVDSDGIAARMAAGTTWSAITLKDAISTRPQDTSTAVLNSKCYMAYDSAVDRLHLLESGGTHRRVGLATPAAPSVANTGGGAYAATPRTYEVAYTVQVAGVTMRRSERSAAVSFTPSGGGTAARVTKPASISEGETHWELYGAATTGDTTYKLLATTVVGTTTYDDSTDPASYSGSEPDPIGTYTVPKSYKFIATDGNRLLGAGSWEGGNNSRLEFTALLGQSGVGNDERIPQTDDLTNYIDIDENDGDAITGISPAPLFGAMYVFKYRSLHKLIATGIDTQPYRRIRLSSVGAVRHHTIAIGEDAIGEAALMWLNHRGPYRYGVGGLEYLGWDIEDLWGTVNLAASTVTAFSLWHADLRQWWIWFATGSSVDPDTLLVFDPRWAAFDQDVRAIRGGWFRYTGAIPNARCATLFANTLGATMSHDLKPYIGQKGAVNRVWKADDDSATNDAGTAFQAYVETPPRPAFPARFSRTTDPVLYADAASGVTISATILGDFGEKANTTGTASLTAAGSETVVRRVVEGLQQADLNFVGYRVGDASAMSNAWTLHQLQVTHSQDESVA